MRFITYLRLNAVSILKNIETTVFIITALAAYAFPFALVYETVLADGANSLVIIMCVFLLGIWTLLFINFSTAQLKNFK